MTTPAVSTEYNATTELDSVEPSKQGIPATGWETGVGGDYDVTSILGQPARSFSVAVGGVLVCTFETGNPRPITVVGGRDYVVKIRKIHASSSGISSTAHGIVFWE